MKEISNGIYSEKNKIFTINLNKGKKVYGEEILKINGKEYRNWNPERSKLAAAIKNGSKAVDIKKGAKILYLGVSTGTTPSHISDIIREDGIIYGVEFAERVMRKFIELSKTRKNLVPIYADARKKDYEWVEMVDIVYVDIADPQETETAIKNCRFLKKNGILYIAVKSQSIDVTKNSEKVYKEESKKLTDSGFEIIEQIKLDPYEKNHAMIIAKKL